MKQKEEDFEKMKRDVKDFLLLQYLGDLTQNNKIINSIDEVIKERYRKLNLQHSQKNSVMTDERIREIVEILTTDRSSLKK